MSYGRGNQRVQVRCHETNGAGGGAGDGVLGNVGGCATGDQQLLQQGGALEFRGRGNVNLAVEPVDKALAERR
jgi:hypothetical protein